LAGGFAGHAGVAACLRSAAALQPGKNLSHPRRLRGSDHAAAAGAVVNTGESTATRASFGGVRADGGEATWRFAAAGVVPDAVVRPAAASEVVEIVRSARECGKALVATGKGV